VTGPQKAPVFNQAVKALMLKEARQGYWKFLLSAGLLAVVGGATPFAFDFVIGILQSGEIPDAILNLIPPEQTELPFFLWQNWHGKTLYQFLTVFSLVFGAEAIAREFGRGTASYLFSLPVSRRQALAAKCAADLGALALGALAGTAMLDISSRLAHGHAAPGIFYLGLLPALAGAAVIYAVALFVSARSDDAVKAGAVAALAALALSVPTWLPACRQWSVYVQMAGWGLFASGRFPWTAFGVMIVSALLLVAAADRRLASRDV